MSIITKFIEQHKQKEYDKPKYAIKDLYIGEIVIVKSRNFIGLGAWENHYKIVKMFAFFKKVGYDEYIHVKSGQKLKMLDKAIVGDYAIQSPKAYIEAYPTQMREDGHTKHTKLSKHFLDKLETAQNKELVGGPIPMHNLFGA